jgi:hypothetical protein
MQGKQKENSHGYPAEYHIYPFMRNGAFALCFSMAGTETMVKEQRSCLG